jgi:hypothetical protein
LLAIGWFYHLHMETANRILADPGPFLKKVVISCWKEWQITRAGSDLNPLVGVFLQKKEIKDIYSIS